MTFCAAASLVAGVLFGCGAGVAGHEKFAGAGDRV